MRRCFQCGTMTDAARMTAVGDGEFCEACFRALLDEASGAPSVAAAPAPVSSAPAGTRERRKLRSCLVCERDIAGNAAVSFLGGELCVACNEQMARELREAEPSAAALAAVDEKAPAAEASPRGVAAGDPQAASFTPGGGTRWCAGCERPMPGPGSYRVIDGAPYCAACVPFYASLKLGERPRLSASPALDDGEPSTVRGGCDCCGATLASASAERPQQPHQGFDLCQACLASDAELALSVARARHRRRLDALRHRLDSERKP